MDTETRFHRYQIEDAEDWHGWIDKIPTINFPPDWDVKIIPPFSGAMARFMVEHPNGRVSVYLDVDNSLGYYGGEPYWEMYPYAGDVHRVPMDATDELVAGIQRIIDGEDALDDD